MAVPLLLRRRTIGRLVIFAILGFVLRGLFGSSSANREEIKRHNVLERVVSRSEKVLDVHRHSFLQARIGRDEDDDLMSTVIKDGAENFWERFQKP